MINQWQRIVKTYSDRKVLMQLFFGLSGGLPFLLTGPTLSYWLKKYGISLTTIGLFAFVATPYSFRFLWAPIVDHYNIPYLTKKLGRRRSWGLASQVCLLLSLSALANCDPINNLGLLAFFAFLVALSSATQDIVLDAYRTEILDQTQYGAGASTYVFGHRLGIMIGTSGAIFLSTYYGWNFTYQIMAGLIFIGIITMLLANEPHHDEPKHSEHNSLGKKPWEENPFSWIFKTIVRILRDFSHREKWIAIMMFIMLYKLSDNLIGAMANPFYITLGFSDTEIAWAINICGLWASVIGGLLAGILISRFGLFKVLVLCGILESLSNLVFIIQAIVGQKLGMFYVTIAIESITSGMAVTAFVAFLSTVCSISYTATHYAMMTSLSSFGRTFFAASSGWMAEHLGWVKFFSVTALAGVPALLLLLYVGPKLLEQRTEIEAEE